MIVFSSRVEKIERKSRTVRAWKEGDEVKTQTQDMGWYLLLEGSWESLYVGYSPPEDLKVGDLVTVTIEKMR